MPPIQRDMDVDEESDILSHSERSSEDETEWGGSDDESTDSGDEPVRNAFMPRRLPQNPFQFQPDQIFFKVINHTTKNDISNSSWQSIHAICGCY